MKQIISILVLMLLCVIHVNAQDTFSIVALDSNSREVGSAGASCLDLDFVGISDPTFLTKLLPDTGAVNIQSYFMQLNQDNAVAHLRMNETPTQIITWLVNNDANSNPEFKQHGIVAFNGNNPSSASHTGLSCISYAGQINGKIDGFHYAIQGNILQGKHILDSMENRFRNTNGDLACRLMAAMQGAKAPGADTRCTSQGLSSKFAFLQVAKANDLFGFPYINVSLKTTDTDTIEPIDSLQTLLNAVISCLPLANQSLVKNEEVILFPNPAKNELYISCNENASYEIQFFDLSGKSCFHKIIKSMHQHISIKLLNQGIYLYNIKKNEHLIKRGKIVID